MLVVGEAGTGKTTLINHLARSLDKKINVVYFPHGNLTFEQMLKEILIKLELPIGRIIKGAMLHQLNEYLIQNLAMGKNLVLIIDEAQEISRDVMEELRLISNLETSTSKLLQIIFVGEPQTETILNSSALRQLKQRIGTIGRIERLNNQESMAYIDYRLQHAGVNSNSIFSPEALALIYKYSDGIPYKINLICHNALIKGFELSQKPVQAGTVKDIRGEKLQLAEKKAEEIKPVIAQKDKPSTTGGNAALKKSLYICLAAAFIILAIFLGKDLFKGIPEKPKPADSLKPKTVSEVAETKVQVPEKAADIVPVTAVESESKTAPAPQSPVVIEPSPAPPQVVELPKQPIPSVKTEIKYKRIIDIGKGANLSSLILDNYNQVNTTLMDLVMSFNPQISNPDLILIDQKIGMPEITELTLISESSDGKIMAHLGTFLTVKEALKYKNLINITDKEIVIIPQNISPDLTWFRVMTGPFSRNEDCLKTIKDLKEKGLLPAFGKVPKL
jgi:type II secretory pathway predicted ATPase ExeA